VPKKKKKKIKEKGEREGRERKEGTLVGGGIILHILNPSHTI
jgi:hypothetical protein